ncbi:unnamed protein product [Brassica oleracea var. botrytis]
MKLDDLLMVYDKEKQKFLSSFVGQQEGVPALIHQSKLSWDASLDPASYFKIID